MTQRERTPGTLPAPGPIGRAARFALGVLVGAVFVAVLASRAGGPPGHQNPSPLFLAAAVVAVYLVADVTDLGFRRRWGATARRVTAGLVVILAVVDVVAYGRWWAPPLAWYLFLLVELTFGFLALSLIVAAVVAAPG